MPNIESLSTQERKAHIDALFAELEGELKRFFQCRETSLAVTNLQQSGHWWKASCDAWAMAGEPN